MIISEKEKPVLFRILKYLHESFKRMELDNVITDNFRFVREGELYRILACGEEVLRFSWMPDTTIEVSGTSLDKKIKYLCCAIEEFCDAVNIGPCQPCSHSVGLQK